MASSWAAAYLPVTQWNSCLSMSSRSPEAPILNMLLLSQESPSSSLIKINQFIASLAVLKVNNDRTSFWDKNFYAGEDIICTILLFFLN